MGRTRTYDRSADAQALRPMLESGMSYRAAAADLGWTYKRVQVTAAEMRSMDTEETSPGEDIRPYPSHGADIVFPASTRKHPHLSPKPKAVEEYPDIFPQGFSDDTDDLPLIEGRKGERLRGLICGDTHDHPGIKDRRRFRAFGMLAAKHRYDFLIHIGDFSDMASMCPHVKSNTYGAREKPTFEQDMASIQKAWDAINDELPASYNPVRHICLGNHEQWLWDFEDKHPETHGAFTSRLSDVIESGGWSWSPYGQHALVDGVAFTHAPMGLTGKALGGVNVEANLANKTARDVVFGHTHRRGHVYQPKAGSRQGVTVINTGSTMPPGYVGSHAKWTPHGITYNLLEVSIEGGRIVEYRHLDLVRVYEELGLGSPYMMSKHR